MIVMYLLVSLLSFCAVWFSKRKEAVRAWSMLFCIGQAVFAGWALTAGFETTFLKFFTADHLGTLFHVLLAVIAPVVFYQSRRYLDTENIRDTKIYHLSLISLCVAATGVYYAHNAAATWIFLEATTLATAGLGYHRRTIRSLEATWKYLFVCSVGIAMAYLGLLLLSTAVTGEEGLSYETLGYAMATANPLYMKMAFLLVLIGYSCKMEIFPLYTVGVDANYTAPTPASALISTGLVNAGFVAFFRIYRVVQHSETIDWSRSVLIVTGVLSVLAGAVYLRRTNNYKRFLAYSTVENMGIVMIGLGLGQAGVFAALIHLVAHTFLKSGLFMQLGQIGRLYGTYRMNRIGNYINVYRLGGLTVLAAMTGLLAFPPSGLFVSELLIFREIITQERWWLLVGLVLLLCLIIYTLSRRLVALVFRPGRKQVDLTRVETSSTWMELALILSALALGMFMPRFFIEFINGILG